MSVDSYNAKVYDSISSNNDIRQMNSDPTDTYVKNLNYFINRYTNLFNVYTLCHLKSIKAKASIFTSLRKRYKHNSRYIRPLLQILRDNMSDSATVTPQIIRELINLLEAVLKQKYFTFNNSFYSQDDGLASSVWLLADVYLIVYEILTC